MEHLERIIPHFYLAVNNFQSVEVEDFFFSLTREIRIGTL